MTKRSPSLANGKVNGHKKTPHKGMEEAFLRSSIPDLFGWIGQHFLRKEENKLTTASLTEM